MARTGKKSTRQKPQILKTQHKRIKKTSTENDRALKSALDKELNSEDFAVKNVEKGGRPRVRKVGRVEEEQLTASFDML